MKKKILNQSGFTMLEAIIGSFLVTIGILSVYALLVSSVRNNSHAMAVTVAATIAADKMEYLNALDGWVVTTPPELTAGSHQESRADGHTVNWSVADIDAANKRLTVTVTDGRLGLFGSRNNVQLTSIKGRDL